MSDHLSALRQRLEHELPDAIRLRHELHRRPELSGREAATRDLVLAAMPGCGGDSGGAPDDDSGKPRQVADTGAVLRIGGPGRPVAVRGELDALAVTEATGMPWASQNPDVMHACGHDVHLAALVALCRAVHAVGGPAPLLAVLQPREETYPSGARDISESGVLEAESPHAMIAAHVQPALPVGTVACTAGAVNASSDEFAITVTGTGGHAAYPHLTHDPVVALAHVVVALQSLVSRGADPMSSVVLSVTTLSAGAAANVVPEVAEARGTVRAMDTGSRAELLRRIPEVVDLVARAHGCAGRVDIVAGEPVLHNDPGIVQATAPLLRAQGIEVDRTLRSAGSDDFAYYSAKLPSLMMFVGTGAGDTVERLHSPTFAPDDRHVGDVARALLAGYLAAVDLSPDAATTDH